MPIDVAGTANRIIANIEKVVIGKRPQITLAGCSMAHRTGFCAGRTTFTTVGPFAGFAPPFAG